MKPLADSIPPEVLATSEERERAVLRWEAEIRPGISGEQPKPGNTVLAEALRLAAARHLEELRAARDAPVAVGEGLAKILAAYVKP